MCKLSVSFRGIFVSFNVKWFSATVHVYDKSRGIGHGSTLK
jgi:hypothetical protein